MTVAALRGVLAEQNQRLLFDIPRADRATIGGALATAVCGPRRFGLGRPRDSIIGVSFVTSNAVEVKGGGRVVKNVAGYDFPKLLTGSLGSLGIITQATLKVRPLPAASALIWFPVDGPEQLDARLAALAASALRPVAFDFLNPSAARLVGEPLGLGRPAWTLVVGIEDDANSVAWQVDRFRDEVGGLGVEVLRDEAAAPLWSALTEFQVDEPGPLACSVRFGAPLALGDGEDKAAFLARARQAMLDLRPEYDREDDAEAPKTAAAVPPAAGSEGAR